MEGIYNIYKPIGLSSFGVVRQLRRLTGIKKIGHAGTLDPLAEGVLVVCVGRTYTRQISEIVGTVKEYLFVMKLGIETETYDQEGKITQQVVVDLTEAQITQAVLQFQGELEQIPPMYSAVHYNGKRLYELARNGIDVERAPRKILIHSIKIESIKYSDNPEVTIRVVCGSGTYVRSLCHDMGALLGCGAYASAIMRTKVGDYNIVDSIKLEDFLSHVNK